LKRIWTNCTYTFRRNTPTNKIQGLDQAKKDMDQYIREIYNIPCVTLAGIGCDTKQGFLRAHIFLVVSHPTGEKPEMPSHFGQTPTDVSYGKIEPLECKNE